MIELGTNPNIRRSGVISSGTLLRDGRTIRTLHGVGINSDVATNSDLEGMRKVTEVVVIEDGEKVSGYRRTASGEIDLLGIKDGLKLDAKTRAKLMNDALSTVASVDEETNVENGELDMDKKSGQMMYLLLNEEQILEPLPPLVLHSTGPGNRYETEACADQWSVKPSLARAMLVMMPVAERMIKPNTGK